MSKIETDLKITPGPWRYIESGFSLDINGDFYPVDLTIDNNKAGMEYTILGNIDLERWDDDDPPEEVLREMAYANARLIAVAPELYAELKRLDPSNPLLLKAKTLEPDNCDE